MKKTIILCGILVTLLSGCSGKLIIDSAGQSGTFTSTQAVQITNDKQHCKILAKEHTNFFSNIGFWLFSPNMDTKTKSLTRKCLNNRGHSVLN